MEGLDLDGVLKIANFLMAGGAMVFAWFATRRKDVDGRLHAGSKRMDVIDLRIVELEQKVQAMPGKDDMHGLQLELVKQTGSLNEMRAVMEGNAKIMARLESIVSRHEDHLLDGKMK